MSTSDGMEGATANGVMSTNFTLEEELSGTVHSLKESDYLSHTHASANPNNVFIIGIAGGSASGKTSVSEYVFHAKK